MSFQSIAKNHPAAEAPHPLKAAQAGELTAETTVPNFVFTSGAAEFMKEPSDTRRFSVTEAAQAGDQNPEGETPPADAGLEVMDEKPARTNLRLYVHPDNPDLTWTGRGRQPKWVTQFLASEGLTLDMLTPAEEKQSSASVEANAKPAPTEPPFKKYQPSNSSEGEAFFDDWCRRCTKDKAMSEGLDPDQCDDDEMCEIIGDSMLYRLDSPSYPSEWRYDQAGHPVCTAFAAVGDPPVTPRCDATVDMFEQSTSSADGLGSE